MNRSKILSFFLVLFLLCSYTVGNVVLAQSGLASSCQGSSCTLCDLFVLINKIFKLIVQIMIVLIVILFAVGGLYFVTSAGNESNISKGKEIMWNSLIGLAITLASYLIVDTFLKFLLPAGSGAQKFFPWNSMQC